MSNTIRSNPSSTINTRASDKLAATTYFNADPSNPDNRGCMLCFDVVPTDPGAPNRLIASPCGHSFCDACIKRLPDRDISYVKKCYSKRTPIDYISANQKIINEIDSNETTFFVSKSVLAIVDCKLDVLKHILNCDPNELDIDHNNISRGPNGKLAPCLSVKSGDLLTIAESHIQKETDKTKQEERQQIIDFLAISLMDRYNSNNSVTDMVKVLDKIIAKNNKETINYVLKIIKNNSSFQTTEAKIAILKIVSQHTNFELQGQFFDALNIDLNYKDIAKDLLPLYFHQEHWPIINHLISTVTGINCLDDLPLRSIIKNYKLKDIKSLLNAGYNLNAKDKNGMAVKDYLLNPDTYNDMNINADMLKIFINGGFEYY